MVIFQIISTILLYICICLCQKFMRNEQDNRTLSMLYSISINTLIILTSTEILSIFHLIQYISLSVLWIITDSIFLLITILIIKRKQISLSEIKNFFAFPKFIYNKVDIFVLLVCCIAVYMAVATVPYNWDSMSYHLTRIAHWAQNGSVAHYACHDISQISASPLAEFVNLHIYILSGYADYFVNFLQTFSYFIIIFLIYKFSEIIGCSRIWCSLAALIFATSPIVFGEAFTTQVDVYSGLWLMVYVYMILYFTDINHKLMWDFDMICKLILMGMSIGFAYLAKVSVCIAVFCFAVWLLIACIRRKDNIFIIAKSVVVVAVVALSIVLPETIRNYMTFHGIFSSETSTDFLVLSLNVRYLFANLIQNIIHNFLPANILNLNFSMGHDTAVNPIIFCLMTLACFIWGIVVIGKFQKRNTEHKISWGYSAASIISMLLFCTVVQWYRYVTRYEIGYIALLAPAVMLIFQYTLGQRKRLFRIFLEILVFLCVITFIMSCKYHYNYSLVKKKRIERYFTVRDPLYEPYREVVNGIIEKQYKDIGFLCGDNSYEYPLWKMLEDSMDRFEHVCVTNETEIYDDENYQPECIIVVDTEVDDIVIYHDTRYRLILDKSDVKLYEKD